MAVLVTIVADRPGGWFPGPLGPYVTFFPAICLSRDFKHAKVPGNPMKTPICFGVFWGGHIQKKIFASRQPNQVKHLLSGPYSLPNTTFTHQGHRPATPGLRTAVILVRISPPISFFFPLTGISARGPQRRSDTALRPDSHFWPHIKLGFPPSALFRKGKPLKKTPAVLL